MMLILAVETVLGNTDEVIFENQILIFRSRSGI